MGNLSSADLRKTARLILSPLPKSFQNFWLQARRTPQNKLKLASSREFVPSYGRILGSTYVNPSEWSWSFLIKPAKKSYRIFGRSHSACLNKGFTFTWKTKICLPSSSETSWTRGESLLRKSLGPNASSSSTATCARGPTSHPDQRSTCKKRDNSYAKNWKSKTKLPRKKN